VGCAPLDADDVVDVGLPVVHGRKLKQIGYQRQLGKPEYKESAAAAQDLVLIGASTLA
jgi:hypothetical protein